MKKINRLVLKNFKCYSNNEIILSKYNLLAGRNSAGKTTLFEAIELFLETEDMISNKNYTDIFKGKTFDTFINKNAEITDEESFELTLNEQKKKYIRNPKNLREIQMNTNNSKKMQLNYIRFTALRYTDTESFYEFNNIISKLYSDLKLKKLLEDCIMKIFDVSSVEIDKYDLKRDFYEVYIEEVLLNDVGYGVKYVFDLMANVLSIDSAIVLIENPELHLHPYAQSKFIFELIDICEIKGHQLIIETHSDHVINAFRKLSYNFNDDVKAIFLEEKIHEIPLKGTNNRYPNGFMDQAKNDILELYGYENNN